MRMRTLIAALLLALLPSFAYGQAVINPPPVPACTTGQTLVFNGAAWVCGSAPGTVTSVALTTPTGLSISGSPVTGSGTLAISLTSGYVIPGGGTSGQVLQSQGASAPAFSSATYPSSCGTAGTFFRSDATDILCSTLQLPDAAATGDLLVASGSNVYGSQAPAALTRTNDTNVTITLGGSASTALVNAASITVGWLNQLSMARGGTNANLTPANGGAVYSTAAELAITAAGTSGQVLTSSGAGAPTWETPTTGTVTSVGLSVPSLLSVTGSPITTTGTLAVVWNSTANRVPYFSNSTTLATTAGFAFNGAYLELTDASGTPRQLSLRYDASNRAEFGVSSAGNLVMDAVGASAGFTFSDPVTFSGTQAAGVDGTFMRSNGTDYVASNLTLPDSVGANSLLYATGADTVGATGGLTYDSTTLIAASGSAATVKLIVANGTGISTHPYMAVNRTGSDRSATLRFQRNTTDQWVIGVPASPAASPEFIIGPDTVLANAKLTITNAGAVTLSNLGGGSAACVEASTAGLLSRASAACGSVTSVAMTVPTGLSVSGSPVTSSGTLALSLTSGYMIPGGGSSGQLLQSQGGSAPAFTTATFPATAAAGDLIYATGANTYASTTRKAAGLSYALSTSYIDGTGTSGSDATAATVKTISIAANSLTQVGDCIVVRAFFRGDTGATGITGVGTINAVTVGAATSNTGTQTTFFESKVCYIDATHANITGFTSIVGAGLSPTVGTNLPNVAGFDWANAQNLNFDQNNVANNHAVVFELSATIYPKGV